MTMIGIKTYSELKSLKEFSERFEYLKLRGVPFDITFGGHRQLNQLLYQSDIWRRTRRSVIIRDGGFDLAHSDYPIFGKVYIHHINPISIDDVLYRRDCLFDLENLISVSFDTHNALHYGCNIVKSGYVERTENDTCPWR